MDETPRCYGHVFDPAHSGNGHHFSKDGWPAHVWTGGATGRCKACPDPVTKGDQYVCVVGGVMHVKCVTALDDMLLGGA
jgi:hypothetical protein